MNEYTTESPMNSASEACAEMDRRVRRNPGTALMIAVGAGLAIGMLVRAMRPEPTPQDRLARILEDVEDRLREVTGPVIRRASSLANDGLEAAHHTGAHAESILSDAVRRVRRMFH